jgi:hypothetical protein
MSHPINTNIDEAKAEMEEENIIQRACDADLYTRQVAAGEIPDAARLTLLDACLQAGLIAYRFTLYVWDRNFNPIADMEFDTAQEAREQVRYLKKHGFRGLVQPIVRKKLESGFMGYHATIGKSWSF